MSYQSPAQEARASERLVWAIKNAIRGLAWRVLETTGAHRLVAPLRSDNCLVLYYRAVFDGAYDLPIDEDNVLDVETFERQMRYLKAHRAVMPLDEVFDHWREHGTPPRHSAVITFDDGFACCRTVAAPILQRLDLPATFFVIPGFTESDVAKWDDLLRQIHPHFDKWIIRSSAEDIREELGRLRDRLKPERVADVERRLRRGMLDWSQMRELIDVGFTVQSHGMEHWYLSSQSETEQRREIAESKAMLEQELGEEVRFFSIPFGYPGSFDATTLKLLDQCGYRGAFGGYRGYLTSRSDAFAMPRVVVHRGISFRRFKAAVSGALF